MQQAPEPETAQDRKMPGTRTDNGAGNVLEHCQSAPIKKIRVAIGIPNMGATCPEAYCDRMLMAFNLGSYEAETKHLGLVPRLEFFWFNTGRIMVQFAREQLAKVALDNDCDYLFMIDDDMLAPPETVLKLLKHNVDIVGCLAFTRNPPHLPVIYSFIDGFDPVHRKEYFINNVVKNYPRDQLVECDAVGFGAVLINTRVFKKIPQEWFMNTSGSGEDIWFCYQAKKHGFKVFMDTSIKLGHVAHPAIITEEYSDRYQKLSAEEREKIYGQYGKYATLALNR